MVFKFSPITYSFIKLEIDSFTVDFNLPETKRSGKTN